MAKAKSNGGGKVASVSLNEVSVTAPMPVTVGETCVGYLTPKQFSTGSYGWNAGGKARIPIGGGKWAEVQVSMNVVVLHSKPV